MTNGDGTRTRWRRLDAAIPLAIKLVVPVLLTTVVTATVLHASFTDAYDRRCAAIAGPPCDGASRAADVAGIAWVLTGMAVVQVIVVCGVFWLFVLRRVRRVSARARQIASEHGAEVPVAGGTWTRTRDELSIAALDVDQMVETLDRHQQTLREGEATLRSILDTTHDAFVGIDTAGRIVDWNRQAERIFGYTRDEALGLPIAKTIIPERFRKDHSTGLKLAAETGQIRVFEHALEFVALHRSGTEFPVELTVWSTTGQDGELRFNAFVRDMTDNRRLEDRLQHQSLHDGLTGLPNRVLFAELLEQALMSRLPGGDCVAVFHLDLDDLKLINNSFGHAVGDNVLLAVTARLRTLLGARHTVARVDGDEFAVLVSDLADIAAADQIAARLCGGMTPPFVLSGRELFVPATVGVAFAGSDRQADPQHLLRDAAAAMHAAKRSGKNSWVRFTDGMHEPAEQRISIVSDLQHAVERGEMELHYQPIVDLASDTVTALEALIRWRHPERGLVAPLDFIPLAEDTGLIIEIGRWVLRTACEQMRRWGDMGFDLTIGVNVAPRELREPTYVAMVVQTLDQTGLRADRLVLELTESTLVTDLPSLRGQLETLRELGVRIALDDFGTGYSSLSYLQHLPIDILKIDKSFVSRVPVSERDAAMVRAIVQIGQPVELNIGAEGVERPEQADALRRLGCEWAQGYWFGRPKPVDDTTEMLTRAVVEGGWADQTLRT